MSSSELPYVEHRYQSLGLGAFAIDPAIIFLLRLERCVLADPSTRIVCDENFITDATAPWAHTLMAPGLPWLDGEKVLLEFFLHLMPNFVPGGEDNQVFQAFVGGHLRLLPFAIPLRFQGRDGSMPTLDAMLRIDRKTILIGRTSFFRDALGTMSEVYREGLYAIENRPKPDAVAGQLQVCENMVLWLGGRKPSNELETMKQQLEIRASELRAQLLKYN